jgi:hypothetical protein
MCEFVKALTTVSATSDLPHGDVRLYFVAHEAFSF